MADVEIIVNKALQDRLIKVYQDFGAYTQQLCEDLVKEEGALTCREAINYSPPLDGKSGGKGDKKIAQRWGNWAVENDIRLVVSDDSRSLAAAVAGSNARQKFNKWKSGYPPNVSGIVKKIWDDQDNERAFKKAQNLFGRWAGQRLNLIASETELKLRHERIRANYKGRIRKNGGHDVIRGGVKGEAPAYADRKMIEAYIKKRQERVGFMKAGWVDAIHKIGRPKINDVPKNFGLRKLPDWVTRHKSGHGGVGLNTYKGAGVNNVMMTVRNDLGNIFGVGYLAGTKTYVMAVRAGKMTKRMNHLMRAAIDKANRNQPPS